MFHSSPARKSASGCLVALLLLAATLPAAGQPASQQPFVESIEVRVANVDVVVTDKSGRPVTGLTKDDFILLENQKPQPITNFYEVRGEGLEASTAAAPSAATPTPAPAPPADLRNRRFVLFLDDYSIHASRRSAVLTSLDRFIDAHVQPGDTVSIVRWLRGIHVAATPTGDKAALHRAIAELRRFPSTATAESEENRIKGFCRMNAGNFSPRAMPGQGQQLCMSEVYQYEMEATAALRGLLADLRRTTASLAGVDGKKVLVLAGSQLPERPGLELYHFANTLFMGSSAAGLAVMQTSSKLPTIEALARSANADGVTIYAIDTQEQQSVATAESGFEFDPMEDFTRYVNSAASYQSLASITGGRAILGSRNLEEAFDTVASDLSSYYSLGYRPGNAADTGNRSISVRTKNPDLRVRGRKSYALKTADEQFGDRVVANLFHEPADNTWAVQVRSGKPVKDGKYFKVPIELTFPPDVTLLPQGDHLAGGFSVYFTVSDADGRISDVVKRAETISITPAAREAAGNKPFVFTAVVMMRPGPNVLSVGIVDSIGGASGFARAVVEVR